MREHILWREVCEREVRGKFVGDKFVISHRHEHVLCTCLCRCERAALCVCHRHAPTQPHAHAYAYACIHVCTPPPNKMTLLVHQRRCIFTAYAHTSKTNHGIKTCSPSVMFIVLTLNACMFIVLTLKSCNLTALTRRHVHRVTSECIGLVLLSYIPNKK